jgi:hypothetical protein
MAAAQSRKFFPPRAAGQPALRPRTLRFAPCCALCNIHGDGAARRRENRQTLQRLHAASGRAHHSAKAGAMGGQAGSALVAHFIARSWRSPL